MFRSDRDALANKVDDLQAENERLRQQNDAMRTDLLAQRTGGPGGSSFPNVYRSGPVGLGPGERVALAQHQLEAFPVWATVLLHIVTFGLSSFIRFNAMHGRLPKVDRDDPSAAKAIGFHFIPYFNLYWVFFNSLRLADRINLQYRLRGLSDGVPRGLVITTGVLSVIPYLNIIAGSVAWLVAAISFQRAVNRLAEMPPYGEEPRAAEAQTGVPGVRIPAVQDLPLPDDVVAQAEADADAEIAEARQQRR